MIYENVLLVGDRSKRERYNVVRRLSVERIEATFRYDSP